jgi:hypothetical protein
MNILFVLIDVQRLSANWMVDFQSLSYALGICLASDTAR